MGKASHPLDSAARFHLGSYMENISAIIYLTINPISKTQKTSYLIINLRKYTLFLIQSHSSPKMIQSRAVFFTNFNAWNQPPAQPHSAHSPSSGTRHQPAACSGRPKADPLFASKICGLNNQESGMFISPKLWVFKQFHCQKTLNLNHQKCWVAGLLDDYCNVFRFTHQQVRKVWVCPVRIKWLG